MITVKANLRAMMQDNFSIGGGPSRQWKLKSDWGPLHCEGSNNITANRVAILGMIMMLHETKVL
jgi:hypothetical protein